MKKIKADDRPVDIRKRTFEFAVRIVNCAITCSGNPA